MGGAHSNEWKEGASSKADMLRRSPSGARATRIVICIFCTLMVASDACVRCMSTVKLCLPGIKER